MKFSIITPTYNRYELLKRAINSLLKQEYTNFEMLIIDDSTNDETYKNIMNDFSDERIKYFKNKKNRGVNYSRNVGLDHISSDSDYFTLLDDDDYFSDNALQSIYDAIKKYKNHTWYVGKRKGITKIKEYYKEFDYLRDSLFGKGVSGDAVHFISCSEIKKNRFSKFVKQAQEYLFFLELGEKNKMFPVNNDITIAKYLDGGLSSMSKWKMLYFTIVGIFELFFVRTRISFQTKFSFLWKYSKHMFKRVILRKQ